MHVENEAKNRTRFANKKLALSNFFLAKARYIILHIDHNYQLKDVSS